MCHPERSGQGCGYEKVYDTSASALSAQSKFCETKQSGVEQNRKRRPAPPRSRGVKRRISGRTRSGICERLMTRSLYKSYIEQ